MKNKILFGLILLNLLFFSSHVDASIIEVHDGENIQSAINSAKAGDIVRLCRTQFPLYDGLIEINSKSNISLIGADEHQELRGGLDIKNSDNITVENLIIKGELYLGGTKLTVIKDNHIIHDVSLPEGYAVSRGVNIYDCKNVIFCNNIVEASASYYYSGSSYAVGCTATSNTFLQIINNDFIASAGGGRYPISNGSACGFSGDAHIFKNNYVKSHAASATNPSYSYGSYNNYIVNNPTGLEYPNGNISKNSGIDAGDPALLDHDGTRSDIGSLGGPGTFDFITEPPEPSQKLTATRIMSDWLGKSKIAVDGLLNEKDWELAPWFDIKFNNENAPSDGTKAKIKILWSDAEYSRYNANKYIYVAIDVSDKHVETSGEDFWNSDSATFSFFYGQWLIKNRLGIDGAFEGDAEKKFSLKPGTTINNNSDVDAGYTIEMKILVQGGTVCTPMLFDLLLADHDNNPGKPYDDPVTEFHKTSIDGDANTDTVNAALYLKEPGKIVSIYTDKKIILDGKLDEDIWKYAVPHRIMYYGGQLPYDPYAVIRTAWNYQNLYVGVDVNDEYVEQADWMNWNDDGIGVSVNYGFCDSTEYIIKNRQDIRGAGEGTAERALYLKPGTTLNNSNNRDKGYSVEFIIPWEKAFNFSPKVGSNIYIDVLHTNHDKNPFGAWDGLFTEFRKVSLDVDTSVDTAKYKMEFKTYETADASSVESGLFSPSYATDRDKLTTRWLSENKDDEWFWIALPKKTRIYGLNLFWDNAFAKEYEVIVSADGIHYASLAYVPNSDGGIDELEFPKGSEEIILAVHCKARAIEQGNSLWDVEYIDSSDYLSR